MNFLDFVILVAGLVGIFSGVLSLAFWFYKWSFQQGVKKYKYIEKQLARVYSPLYALYLDTHLCSSTIMIYPYIQIRLRRAVRFFYSGNLGKAMEAIFDQGVTKPKMEVEYGVLPDWRKVDEIVTQNINIVNSELLSLYTAVQREKHEYLSRGEGYPPYFLTNAYINFVDHIFHKREELSQIIEKSI